MNKKHFVVAVALCLIATLFIVPTVLAYTTNDVYYIVRDIRNKVNSIYSKLCSMQSMLNNLYVKLWSGSNSVKNDTLAINAKLENITKMESYAEKTWIEDYSYAHEVSKSKPFKVSITIAATWLEPGEIFGVWYKVGDPSDPAGYIQTYFPIDTGDKMQTFEFVCHELLLKPISVIDGFQIYYSFVITYSE